MTQTALDKITVWRYDGGGADGTDAGRWTENALGGNRILPFYIDRTQRGRDIGQDFRFIQI